MYQKFGIKKEIIELAEKVENKIQSEHIMQEKIEDITKRCWEYMNNRRVPPVDNMAQFKYWIK